MQQRHCITNGFTTLEALLLLTCLDPCSMLCAICIRKMSCSFAVNVNSQYSFLVLFQCYLHSHTGSDVIIIMNIYTRGRRSHNTAKYAIINDSHPITYCRVSRWSLMIIGSYIPTPPHATTRRHSEGSHHQNRTLDSAPLYYIPPLSTIQLFSERVSRILAFSLF